MNICFYLFIRETMERCWALYAEVQRSVGRLGRLVERRKAQLERHLPGRTAHLTSTSTLACRQVTKKTKQKNYTTARYKIGNIPLESESDREEVSFFPLRPIF